MVLFASWRLVCLHEVAALVHYSLFRFELLACHLTIDQASKRPEGLVCADGNDRSVIDPNLFVPLRHAHVSAPQIQTVHLSPTPLLKLGRIWSKSITGFQVDPEQTFQYPLNIGVLEHENPAAAYRVERRAIQ